MRRSSGISLATPSAPGGSWQSQNLLYYTSHEVGGDGSNAAVLGAEDFGPLENTNLHSTHPRKAEGANGGSWYHKNADENSITPTSADFTCGWEGSIFPLGEPITPAGAIVDLGTPPNFSQSRWAATSGLILGVTENDNARLSAWRHFPRAVTELNTRFYTFPKPGYLFGSEKVLVFNRIGDDGGIYWCGLGFNPGAFPGSGGDLMLGYGFPYAGDLTLTMNVDPIEVTASKWWCVEAYIKLNTNGNSDGIFKLWVDDCGATGINPGSQTLRMNYTGLNFGYTGGGADQGGIGTHWYENWANTGASADRERYWTNFMVKEAEQCGFAAYA